MRRVLIIIMAVLVAACSSTPEERAVKMLTEYIESGANDPSSVQDVRIGALIRKKEMDDDAKWVTRQYTVVWWREKNVYGALVKRHATVAFDEDVTQLVCFNCFGY